jgi:hypothetical protein
VSTVATRSKRVSLERGTNPLVYAQRLYVQFLQGLFNFNAVECLHWEPDEEITEIVIRAEAPLNMKSVGKRPVITVVMGPTQFQGLGIDQMQSMDLAGERRVHTDLISGHLVVYCLAETDVVAQWIAHMVVHGTLVNRRLLESSGGFHQIARPAPSMNAPSPPGALIGGDPAGLVMVQVNLPFAFQWMWSAEPTAPSQARSLDMVTSKKRASDYPYTSPSRLEKVELAMSAVPVTVRRLSGATITTETILNGIDDLQVVLASTSSDEA